MQKNSVEKDLSNRLYKKRFSTPIGWVTLVASDVGVYAVSFEKENGNSNEFEHAQEFKDHPVLKQCEKELREYFQGRRTEFSVPLAPEGTEFQRKVWDILREIPFGKTESYLSQAKRMKKPLGVRAVAAANGRNPIAIIIPCHRVIASTGHLHGYAGGLEIKRKLLEIEGVRIKNFQVEA